MAPLPHDTFDHAMMRRAIALARRGEGRVEPNPMVGCVIVRGRRVIGEGYHRRFGGPHAEIEALAACDKRPRGATVYITLEPCSHTGKTPPCTEALIRAGVARVVVARRDPHRAVNGRGIRRLRSAGIDVVCGTCRSEASDVLAPFLTRVLHGRPYVIAKWAQSLDGKLCTRTGQSKWISCDASRRRVHRLRARMDAVVVGAGTAAVDDPLLTARDVPVRRAALRVIVAGRLRVTPRSRLARTARQHPTVVMTTARAAKSTAAARLRRCGVEVVGCRSRGDRVSPADMLRRLADRDATNVLVEGGPSLLTSLFEARLVDEAFVFTAPILIGGDDARGPIGGRGAARIDDCITPTWVRTSRSGRDVLVHMRLANAVR